MSKQRRSQPSKPATSPALYFIVGGVALFLIAIAVLVFNNAGSSDPAVNVTTTGAPALVVDKTEVNLGDVKLGQWVQAEFKVSNAGDQPLKFSEAPYISVKEGC